MEDKCTDSKLETARLVGKINALTLVAEKFDGERYELKGLVKMMKRERTALSGRIDNLPREGEGNRFDIVGLRFYLEEAETRCSRITYKDKESSL